MRVGRTIVLGLIAVLVDCGTLWAQAQLVAAAPLLVRAGGVISRFAAGYSAGEIVDYLRDEGRAVRDSLAVLRDNLTAQARINAANRQILLRQAALLQRLEIELDELMSRRPTRREIEGVSARTADILADLQAIQADHDRRIGQLEAGVDSLRRLVAAMSLSTSTPSPPVVRIQRLEYVEVEAVALERTGRSVRATLRFTNRSGDRRGVALAFNAVGSGGIADYWKFMPQASGSLTDDVGGRYQLAEASGLGFARTASDWNILSNGASVVVVLDFTGAGQSGGRRFAVSLNINMAWRDLSNQQHHGPYTVLLRDLEMVPARAPN